MKICKYCRCEYVAKACPNCGSAEYEHKCDNCATIFSGRFCSTCGKSIDDKMRFCTQCGKKTFKNFCPECGNHMVGAPRPSSSTPVQVVISPAMLHTAAATVASVAASSRARKKWVTFFLCLFFGYLGLHKFYERKNVMGFIYLFTFGLFGIGLLLDLIIILCKPKVYYI